MLIILFLSLASCSTPNPVESGPSELTPSSQTLSATTSSQPESTEAHRIDFYRVIVDSCEKALAVGVEEATADSSFAYYLFPEELSIEGYSAVEYDKAGDEVSLVWETDVFYVCYFANQIALAEEFGTRASISFLARQDGFDLVDSSFVDESSYQISVSDDLISSVYDGNSNWVIKYGVDESKVSLLERAVKEFLD